MVTKPNSHGWEGRGSEETDVGKGPLLKQLRWLREKSFTIFVSNLLEHISIIEVKGYVLAGWEDS